MEIKWSTQTQNSKKVCSAFPSLSLSLSLSKLFGLVFWFVSPLRGLCFEGMVLFGFGSVLFWKLEKGLFVGIF